MVKIKEFQWDKGNENHIRERHNVTKFEAEEVFSGDPYFRVGGMVRDMFTVKQAVDDICLSYICIGNGVARVVTARDIAKSAKEDYTLRGDSIIMAKIPKFRTEQEMQEFWDAHDSVEYFEDMKDDEIGVEFNRDKGVLVIPMGGVA